MVFFGANTAGKVRALALTDTNTDVRVYTSYDNLYTPGLGFILSFSQVLGYCGLLISNVVDPDTYLDLVGS